MEADTQKQQKILRFIQDHHQCVLSTFGKSSPHPESALVLYAPQNFDILVNTLSFSRKIKNIQQNPCVSLVIGFGDTGATIQYEGVASILSPEEVEQAKKDCVELLNTSWSEGYDDVVNWVRIRPKWINYVDINSTPITEFSITF